MEQVYKNAAHVNKIDEIIEEIKTKGIKILGIDTETNGLDPKFSTPYQVIIGWEYNGQFEHYIIDTSTRDSYVVGQMQKLMDFTQTEQIEKVVYHNASFDIKIIQNLGVNYTPKNFFCTMLAVGHITKLSVFGLKGLAEILKLRARFPNLDQIWANFTQAQTKQEQANIIRSAIQSGDIPMSNPVQKNLAKLELGEDTQYFEMLFNKPDALRDFYLELESEAISERFANFAKKNYNWEKSLVDTYNFITDVYSTGIEFEAAREVLRDFNQQEFGFKNEWARLYKGASTKVLNVISFEVLQQRDPAAMMIYAGMDVLLTLKLYNYLCEEMVRTSFDEASRKVLQNDFDVLEAIHMQEKTGLAFNAKYAEDALDGMKKTLLQVNTAIATKFDFITKDDTWKEQNGLSKEQVLQANNYATYNLLFEKYIPFLPLPVFVDTKKKIKIDTVKKLVKYLKLILPKQPENVLEDEELYDAFVSANTESMVKVLAGESGADGIYRETFTYMLNTAQQVLGDRLAAIAEAEANNKKLKLRKEEEEIQTALQTCKTPIELMEKLYEVSPKCRKAGNQLLKGALITIVPATRTINNKTNDILIRGDVDEEKLTDDEKAVLHEGREIIRLKSYEASLLKWIGTYQIKLLAMHSMSKDDRIRTIYNLHNVKTGRLSTDVHQFPKANITNPFTGEEVYHPRRAFEAKSLPEWGEEKAVLAYLDFSQMELRGAAEFTLQAQKPDVNLLRAYVPFNCFSKELGIFKIKEHKHIWHNYVWYVDQEFKEAWETVDLHMSPVKLAFPHMFDEEGNPKPEFEKEVKGFRNATKSVNFGKIYGQGLSGLLGDAKLVEFDKQALTDIYNAQEIAYPNLKLWMRDVINFVNKNGFIRSLQGRKYIKGFPWGKNKFGGNGYQEAYKGINYLVQGESAGQLKARMIEIHKYIKDNNLKMRMIQNVHDEVAYLIPYSELNHLFTLQKMMENFPWDVNMVSDVEITKTNWAEKHLVTNDADVKEYIENE